MNKIKSFIWLIVGICIYIFVFNWVNPEYLIGLTRDVISLKQIEEQPDKNYIGFKAGKDIPRLKDEEDLNSVGIYATIETIEAVNLQLYKIKNKEDMERLRYRRNSKGRKVYKSSKKIPEYTKSPGSYKGYYNPFYLVKLEDDTYVVTYLEECYGKKILNGEKVTLPIGQLVDMTDTVRGAIQEIQQNYTINNKVVLCCFNDEAFAKYETIYVIIRGSVAFLVIAMVFIITCKFFPVLKIDIE